MMNDETIAALQAGALSLTAEAALMEPRSIVLANQYREQAALIRALIERDKQPPIVRIDPAQYEDGLYLNPITGAVMWIAAFPPVGGGHAK